jgi:hypothetical protein
MKPILKINIIEHNFLPKWIFKESEYCHLLSSRYIDQLFQKNEKCVIFLHNVFTTIHRSSSALAVTSFMVPLFTLAGSESMS